MSKRAFGSAFHASPPHGARDAANGLAAPQPQALPSLYASPSSLRIPGQWPEEESFAPADEEALPRRPNTFLTIGRWVATVAVPNLLALPQRFAQTFWRRQTIAAVPVVREDGSIKKRLVDLGGADEPAAQSPSARARANAPRRRARQPATTPPPGAWYDSPEPSASPGRSRAHLFEDISMTDLGLEDTDHDDSLSFSFSDSDVWTSPLPQKSPTSSPPQKSEALPLSPPTAEVSPTPTNKLRHPFLNNTPFPTPLRTTGRTPARTPLLRRSNVDKFNIHPNLKLPGLPRRQPPAWVTDMKNAHAARKEASQMANPPRLPALGTYSRQYAPSKPMMKDPMAALKFTRAPAPPRTHSWTQLGKPLIIDPSRPPGPLYPQWQIPRYYEAPLPRAMRERKEKEMLAAQKAYKMKTVTPMRRQLLKVQLRSQAPQEQYSSGLGTSTVHPTHVDEPAAPSSFETNVKASSSQLQVEPSPSEEHRLPEESFSYENDLSFLPDAPTPSPRPARKTVKWSEQLREMKFFCDENVNRMMESVSPKALAAASPKASDADDKGSKQSKSNANGKEFKEPQQSRSNVEEPEEDTSRQSLEYEDDSSGISAERDGEVDGVSADAAYDEDASCESSFDEGSNISQIDLADEQSLEESEISLELLEELRQGLEQDLTLQPPPAPVVKPLVSPLDSQEQDELVDIAEKAISSTKPDFRIVKKLSLRDFGTLLPEMFNGSPKAWLNDNIVNEYLSIIVDHKKKEAGFTHQPDGPPPPVHAFVSFWYQSSPASIAKWAKKVQLEEAKYLESDLILYPICDGGHWRLLAVKPKARIIEYFDSLGFSSTKYITKFKEYIQHQLGSKWVEDEWTVVELQNSQRQLNGSDCGVFTVLNALVLLRGEGPKRVVPDYGMEDARKRIATTLLAGHPTTEWA